jgi:hypothetical protein
MAALEALPLLGLSVGRAKLAATGAEVPIDIAPPSWDEAQTSLGGFGGS